MSSTNPAPPVAPATAAATPAASAATGGLSRKTLGYIVQLGGIAAFTVAAILSVHHIAIGASFLGGAAAFFVGEKIRTLS